jgi:hypothetical protein
MSVICHNLRFDALAVRGSGVRFPLAPPSRRTPSITAYRKVGGFLRVRTRTWVIRFDRRTGAPTGAFLEHRAPARLASGATSPPLAGGTTEVALPPGAKGPPESAQVRLIGGVVRGRPLTSDFDRGPR